MIQAGAGFVEKEQLRPGGHGPGEFDHPGQARRHRVDRLAGHLGQADPLDDRVGEGADVFGLATEPPQTSLCGYKHILPRGEGAEYLETLESAGDTHARPLVRLGSGDVDVSDEDLAPGRGLESGDHVEKRGFAGPIRADEAGHLTGLGPQGHAL